MGALGQNQLVVGRVMSSRLRVLAQPRERRHDSLACSGSGCRVRIASSVGSAGCARPEFRARWPGLEVSVLR